MRAKHIPLWARILLLAMLNLALLAGIFVLFLQSRLETDLDSFLMAGARDRISALASQVAADLSASEPDEWNAMFERYSQTNGIRVLLYRNTRDQLAGPPTAIPAQVDARMPPRPGPRNGPGSSPQSDSGGPPPHRGDFGNRGKLGDRGSFGPRGDFDPRRGSKGGPEGPPPDGPVRPFLVVTDSTPKYWTGLRMPVVQQANGERLLSVLVLTADSFFLNPFFFEARSWFALGGAAVLISVVCWLPLVHNITRSVTDMMQATGRIAAGRFDVEVRTERQDELGRLGMSIKQMANRLETYTAGRTRFLGSVAHELRSPIARMQLATEILERSVDVENRKYLDYLKGDIQTMAHLTDELLQVARAESAPGPVKLQPLRLAEIVENVVRREVSEGPEVLILIDPGLSVQANREYLERTLGNILRNAVRHARQHGPIDVSAARNRHEVEIIIGDFGPGVPASDLDNIFMPFYRVDDARDRRSGGTGLGLAIVRSCIEACGGKVAAKNRQPSGLQIVITLPAA